MLFRSLAKDALTEEEAQIRRQRWQQEDEALQREFLAYRAQLENAWPGDSSWSDRAPHDGQDPA